MKKVLLCTLTLLVCLSFATVFAGCNVGTAEQHQYSTDWSIDDDYHWVACVDEGCTNVGRKGKHVFEGGTCTTCGYQTSNEQGEDYYKVANETAWVSALSFKNISAYKMLGLTKIDGAVGEDYEFGFDNGVIYETTKNSEGQHVYENYYGEDDGVYYVYSVNQTTGRWYRTPTTASVYASMFPSNFFAPIFEYDNFAFDAESKTYKQINDIVIDGAIMRGAMVKFEDGRLVSVECPQYVEGGTEVVLTTVMSFVYDGVSYELPTVDESADPDYTDYEFMGYFDFSNVTIIATMTTEVEGQTVTIDYITSYVDGNVWLEKTSIYINESETYFDGENLYKDGVLSDAEPYSNWSTLQIISFCGASFEEVSDDVYFAETVIYAGIEAFNNTTVTVVDGKVYTINIEFADNTSVLYTFSDYGTTVVG